MEAHNMFTLVQRKLRQLALTMAFICPLPGLRLRLLKLGGIEIGADAYVNMLVMMTVDIPNGVTVKIGKRVAIAPGALLIAVSHANQSRLKQFYPEQKGSIILEDDAWIGANVTVLPGITIGRMAVVGAGAVVTRNVEPGSVVVGTPARVVKRLPMECLEKEALS